MSRVTEASATGIAPRSVKNGALGSRTASVSPTAKTIHFSCCRSTPVAARIRRTMARAPSSIDAASAENPVQ